MAGEPNPQVFGGSSLQLLGNQVQTLTPAFLLFTQRGGGKIGKYNGLQLRWIT